MNVVRVFDPIVVAVGSEDPPARGNELERADGSVPGGVSVPRSVVGVGNAGGPICAIEWYSDDRGSDDAIDPEF